MANHRIKTKIGDNEFEAEGTPEVVQAQYDQWLGHLSQSAIKPKPQSDKGNQHTHATGTDETIWPRIFELRPDGFVTLKVLPKGDEKEGDAFLLILYGYRRLKQEETVMATHLLRAAELSGLSSYRPAHALAAHDRYVIRGGQKKGTTYTLNNQGVNKAEEIGAKIFE